MEYRRARPWRFGLGRDGHARGEYPSPLNKLAVPLLNSQVNQEFAPYFKKAIIRDLFRGEKTLGKTLACGVGMPVARAVEAMEIAFEIYNESDVVLPLILSHRFVKGTKALLGFTRFDYHRSTGNGCGKHARNTCIL